MPRKPTNDLTQIGELLPGMGKLAPVLKEAEQTRAVTVQGKHHYTRYKQIDALIDIGEDPNTDMGFMARLLTLCSLPRTDPGARLQYKRQNGPYKLIMIAGGDNKLPFGNLPRLLLAWVSTEAVRTQNRELVLGSSLLSFMRQLGMSSNSGGERSDRTRLKSQIDRLFNAHVQLIYETPGHKATASSAVADRTELWWDYRHPEQDTLWQSHIRLGEDFFNEIIAHPVPLDMRILKEMRRSSLGLDLYMWISYKSFTLYSQRKKPERLSWERLYGQFGADPAKAGDKFTVRNFRQDVIRELKKLKLCWPSLDYGTPTGCLEIRACAPSINPKAITA
jgi:Plasmid encoded RepA protein